MLYAVLVGVLLGLFGLAQAFDAPFATGPDPLRGRSGAMAALVGVTLLVADVVLPVPSSVVMVTHGALFGVAAGTGLSMAGSLGAFGVAFAVGRRGRTVVVRAVGDAERHRADRLLERWGVVAIVLSRPLPILAEAVAFAAGGSPLPWLPALAAAALGSLPAAAVYAVAGAWSVSFATGAVVFVVVAVLAVGAGAVVRPKRVAAQSSRS